MRWDREKFLESNSHVYGENGAEVMVYNMKRNPKKKKWKKNREKERFKKYNSKKEKLYTIDHTIQVKLRIRFLFCTYNSSS